MWQPYSQIVSFKPLSSRSLPGTQHKGVWLAFARAVPFVFAWLLIWGLGKEATQASWESSLCGDADEGQHGLTRWTEKQRLAPVTPKTERLLVSLRLQH